MSKKSPPGIFTITEDWPRRGVRFYNFTPWLQNIAVFNADLLALAKRFSHLGITHVVYIGDRGFLMNQLSVHLKAKTAIIRKKGSMPPPFFEETYSGEYRDNTTVILCHGDIQKGARVLLVDDVLATGGTALASVKLAEKAGAHVVGFASLLELEHLNGTNFLKEYKKDLVVASSYIAVEDGSFFKNELPENDFAIPGQRSILDEPLHAGDDRAVVMWQDTVVEQARDIVQRYPYHFVGSRIKINRFPDGHYDIEFNPNLIGRHLTYVMSLLHPEESLYQLELLIALTRQHVKSFTVLIAYFAPGTKERVDQPGELARAQTTAQLISASLKAKPMLGPATVIIYDIHAVQEQFYFKDSCSLALLSSTSLMGKVVADEKMVLVFPDQGAHKRFGKEPQLKNVPTLICNKERGPNDSRVIVIADRKNCGNMKDEELLKRHLLIYDDIGHSGGTSYETYLMLKKLGYEEISLYVTHAVFSLQAWMRFLPSGDRPGFKRIYTTNTVPSLTDRYLKFYPETFTVLDLTSVTADFICQKYDIKPSTFVPPAKIWYATTSKPKVEAILNVFPKAKFLTGADTSSDVNPQPMGYVEIHKGVKNRMDKLTDAWKLAIKNGELSPSPTLLISIETGLCRHGSKGDIYRDQTAILVRTYGFDQSLTAHLLYQNVGRINDGPRVPSWVIDIVTASKFQKTAGEIICEKYPEQGLDAADWYLAKIEGVENENVSRVEYITSLLKEAHKDADYDFRNL